MEGKWRLKKLNFKRRTHLEMWLLSYGVSKWIALVNSGNGAGLRKFPGTLVGIEIFWTVNRSAENEDMETNRGSFERS